MELNKKISVGASIMIAAMTAAVTITVTIVVMLRVFNGQIADFSRRAGEFKKLETVDSIIRNNYIGKVDETQLNDDLVSGYMKGIGDKYGTYLDADSYNRIQLENEGKTTGIGVNVVENGDGYIQVVMVVDGSPAKSAGVQAGDVITQIGGQDVKSMGYTASVNLLKGSVGSTVSFTVLRDSKSIPLSIVRKTFETKTVQTRMIGDVGYVRIYEFDGNTSDQFSKGVDGLMNQGAKALVFDVRNNPGGVLDSVEKMIDKLVPEGPVVRAKYKDGVIRTLYKSDASQINLPMAVLTNQNTASAAELFTAALKDYGKAKSVGTKTYGKGTMQKIIPLNDGTALDLSVAYFYPPRSDNFEGKGVSPDISVELSTDKQSRLYSLSDSEDDQLQAALSYLKTAR